MKLSEKSARNILGALKSKSLLKESIAEELVESLQKQRDINWNLVLTKQFQSEQGGHIETES